MYPGIRNFKPSEWSNPRFSPYPTEWIGTRWVPQAQHLQIIRDEYDHPMIVSPNGGYRDAEHNRKQGGAKDSQHLHGYAADILAPGELALELWNTTWELYHAGRLPKLSGIGLYLYEDDPATGRDESVRNFVHIDVGGKTRASGKPRRWISRTGVKAGK